MADIKQFQVTDVNNVTHAISAFSMLQALGIYRQVIEPKLNSGEPIKVELVNETV